MRRHALLFLIISFNLFGSCFSANRFWVASTPSNWDNTTNWSITSGGAGGATVPNAADIAVFNSSASGNCNINAPINVRGFNIVSYAGVITQNGNSISIGSFGFSQNSGTFTSGSATITLTDGDFNLSGGVFNAPPAGLYVGGLQTPGNANIFVHSGGTFAHNNGIVFFNPFVASCSQFIYTIDVLVSTVFYDVEVNLVYQACGINHIITTAPGDVVNALRNLTHTDGIINGLFTLDNNLLVNLGADGGAGIITFDGTSVQTYSQAPGSQRACAIAINKASGGVSPAAGSVDFTTQGFNQIFGNFTAPSGNFGIGGPINSNQTIFNHQAGAFTHNNGNVIFNPFVVSCSQYTYTIDVLPSTVFYDVEVNLAYQACSINHILTTASGDVLNASRNFKHTDGIISGLFNLNNNLVINSGADGGNGVITFVGTGAQTYSQAPGSQRACAIAVNKSFGAVTPAVGNVDLTTQGFNQISGDFTAPGGNFSIGGSINFNQTIFNHQAGTFNHNNGKVIFNPFVASCSQYIYSIDVLPSTVFYDVEVDLIYQACGINHILTTASGDVVNALRNFTHTDGVVNGLFTLDNNLFINSGADGGNGIITFDGMGAQTYSQAPGSPRACAIAVNKALGAVTPAFGNTDFTTQGFNQISGNFTAPTGTFSIGGNINSSQTIFNHQAGAFTHNNGIVTFNPSFASCSQNTYTIDVLPSTVFYNLNVNLIPSCVNHRLFTGLFDTINCLNNLRYIDGISDANFEARGNVTVSSTFDGGSGRLVFSGSNSQDFQLTSANNLFDGTIILNKSVSNNVNLISSCNLDAGAAQSVIFNKGILVSSNSNLLLIGNSTTVSNANDSSYVRGPIRKTGNQAFIFPIGRERFNGKKYYRPIAISAPSAGADHFTAEYFAEDPNPTYTTTSKDVTLDRIGRCEHWSLDRTGGSSNVNVSLSWRDSASCGVTNLSELRVARWNGTTWKDHGNGGVTSTINSGNVVTSGVVNAFSPFTLGSTTGNNILPIELISFEGNCLSNKTEFKWSTLTESNNKYFILERSYAALNWEPFATISGAINSVSKKNYDYSVASNDSEITYYRLKQVDVEGAFKYSKIISVACNKKEEDFDLSIYPNPSDGIFHLVSASNKDYRFDVYSATGQLVFGSAKNEPVINLRERANGVYFVHIRYQNESHAKQIILRE